MRKKTCLLPALWYLKKIHLGSLIPRFSLRANENPTASNEMLGGAWERDYYFATGNKIVQIHVPDFYYIMYVNSLASHTLRRERKGLVTL